jgi:hypothetical protein
MSKTNRPPVSLARLVIKYILFNKVLKFNSMMNYFFADMGLILMKLQKKIF